MSKIPVSLFVSCILLTACGPSKMEQLQAQVDDISAQLEDANSKLSDARDKAADVRTEAEQLSILSDDLETETGRFGSENWQSVVPEVALTSLDIDTSQQILISYLDELDAALEE
jgi:hypothetical protein